MWIRVILIALVVLAVQKWEVVDNYLNPPPDYALAHGGKVILYATSWCGYCEKARQLMQAHNIDYYEYDIENSAEGKQQHAALGGRGVPVLLIDRQVVKGYDPDAILRLAQ